MAGPPHRRPVYQCPCSACGQQPRGGIAQDHRAINRVLALPDERQRRLFAGLLAVRRGHGGVVELAGITGLSRTTIRRGQVELRQGAGLAEGRVRRGGGGRPRAEKKIRPW
jgi:hypothetical protein